ncbi:unnamed protein product [Dovyalis caffra]|uniref:Glutamate receptor n=1 Tax=Dovyalis caffra TaxID=77055 RepID=A0AAV1SLE0_9ROSI|nr:unnamed protein product [Dovyalis caffra]
MQANFVIDLGEKAQVPIISFSASCPFLTSKRSPYFLRATNKDSSQTNAISSIVQAFGWREAVPIYVDNEYGEGIIPYLIDSLQAVDARVPYRSVISPSATDDQIAEELYKLMTMQTRVFIVHMFPSLAARVFAKAKEIGMMSEGYVWIMTDGFTNVFSSSSVDASVIDTMQGVLGVKPYVPKTKELENFRGRWKRKFYQDNPEIVDAELNIYGLWAYDAATALAFAVEKAGTSNLGFRKADVSSNSSTDLGVSLNGPNLLQALSNISFKGLTGDYLFINGELESPALQIVNVNGNGGREIGFWTPTKGLVKNLISTKNISSESISLSGISTVIWPGDTIAVPKGWEVPTSEKKLKIGVPMKGGLNQLVVVTNDSNSNTPKVSGFCIDVFDAVVKALPYGLPYEYIPFAKPDGEPAGTYDDLVYQVHLKNYDAVVGDVSIVFNRSLHIDYTLPFTESGVSMIVPITDNKSKNAWVFLKPLTWDLWSYTASLSSLLTVQQLQPTVTDVQELIKKGEFVGYQEGSFVLGILLDLGFDKSKLMAYSSPEQCHELFSKGRGKGGIAAAFDEVPCMKVFLSKYCSKYTMVDPTFKTGGFGFVFPKGSPLVPDISRAILNITEGDQMKNIEDTWFGKHRSCPDSSTSVSSNSLSLESFWGLFLIAGIAALLALIIFTVMFVYQERRVLLRPSDSTTSIWTRLRHLFSIFNQRDLTSQTFRKSEVNDRNGIDLPTVVAPSPSAYSVHTEFPGDPSSAEYDSSPNSQEPQVVVMSADQLNSQAAQVVVMIADQLSNPNQGRPAAFQFDHENN